MLKKVIPVEDAIAVLHDGDVLATTGYGGHGIPEQLLVTLEQRFLQTGTPRGLTLVHSTGQGDGADKGLNHLGHEGLLKRVIGGHYGLMPKVVQLVLANKIEAYNLPEGAITHLYRDIAAGKPGMLSKVGLGTFVDPRLEGGKMNRVTQEDLVTLMTVGGEEYLFYKALPINVAFIRGTTADPDGNITMEREALVLENLAMALAAKNSHGYVICQVERIAAEGTLDSRQVRIPGVLVDAVVVAEPQHHMQTWGIAYNPALSGEVRIPTAMLPPLPLDDKKVIARRAAMELVPSSVVNLGLGIPDNVGRVAERGADLRPADPHRGSGGDGRHSRERRRVRGRHQLPGGDRSLLAVRLHRRGRPRRRLPGLRGVRRHRQRQREPLRRPHRGLGLHQHQPEQQEGRLHGQLRRAAPSSRCATERCTS